MKSAVNKGKQVKQAPAGHKHRPEIRDNMDSRQNKEIGYKGDRSKKGDRGKYDTKS